MIGYITHKKKKKKNIDRLYRLQKNNFCVGAFKDKIYPESKDASVFSLLSSKGEEGLCNWNLRFICDFHDWELELSDSNGFVVFKIYFCWGSLLYEMGFKR